MKKLIIISALLLSGCATISSGNNYDKIVNDAIKEKTTFDRDTAFLNNLEKGLINQASKI